MAGRRTRRRNLRPPRVAHSPAGATRAVLYEEDASTHGRQTDGSTVWRTERDTKTNDLVVRADIEIPDRRMRTTLRLLRNSDASLPASHLIEVSFHLPPDFPNGSIGNVPGLLMKTSAQTRGVPLAGLAVRMGNAAFLVGLSQEGQARNVQLLTERAWMDIPIVYGDGKRAILAIEKGASGERAFNDAMASWRTR
jgi:hypothetical protein